MTWNQVRQVQHGRHYRGTWFVGSCQLLVGCMDSKSSHLHFFTSLLIQFEYGSYNQDLFQKFEPDNTTKYLSQVNFTPLKSILVRFFQISLSVGLQVLRLSLSLWIQTSLQSHSLTINEPESIMIIWLCLLNDIAIFVLLDMKCHTRLCILMPYSHSSSQEGSTRCSSTCGRCSHGSQHWHCCALEFCSGSSRGVSASASGARSKLMLTSSSLRAKEFSTGSLFGLTHCASCSACLHFSQPSAQGGIRKNKICITYTTCLAHILKHSPAER